MTAEAGPLAGCLDGLVIIELGQVLAAPFGGMIFSDLGAEVIKVERPGEGDDGRRMGPAYDASDALIFRDLNRGKKSVEINLKTEEGVAELIRLAGKADIVFSNLRPGICEAGGFDGPSLRMLYPRLIFCNLSAFGSHGPMKQHPGYEPLVQAYSGLAATNGFEENPPVRTGPSVVDLGSGMWIVISALAALRRRDQTGEGATIDLSLLETALTWIGPDVSGYLNEGRVPVRRGNAHPLLTPYQAFAASNGMLMLAIGNDRLFQKLASLLERPEWAEDPDYASNAARLSNRERLVELVAEVIAEKPVRHWVDLFEANGIPAAEFNLVPDALDSPQVRSLEFVRTSPVTGRKMLGLPFCVDGRRPGNLANSPGVGEHNALLYDGK